METRTILVGSDLTKTSDSALAHALQLGPSLDAHVVLVHVVERSPVPRGSAAAKVRAEIAAFEKVIDWQLASAEQLLARQLRRVRGKKGQVALEVRSGKPAVELLAAARKRRACLLVLGLTQQSGSPGHVAQRVLAATDVPVLLVPSTYSGSSQRTQVPAPTWSAQTRQRPRAVRTIGTRSRARA